MDNRPLLLGHRGSRTRGCRENTIAAFETAMRHGCDGFEFDVRLTCDERAVVCHDARSRGRLLTKNPASRLPHLPSLDDVLARFAETAYLDIELKVAGMEEQLLSALEKCPPRAGYVVSSFSSQALTEMKAGSTTVPLGLIFERRKIPRWQDLPVDYVMPHRSLVTPELIERVHDAGKRIVTWTVNDKRSMRRFTEWGVDGIISDKTDVLATTLRRQGGASAEARRRL
jgi:glycerophosphoryl diester phosphodiesterase